MARYQVMSWREIPSQVRATDDDGGSANVLLPAYFQQQIDRVAMAEGLIDSDAYLEAWGWSDPVERKGSAEDVADAVATEVGRAWQEAHQASG